MPTGTATTRAMAVVMRVPTIKGSAPNTPWTGSNVRDQMKPQPERRPGVTRLVDERDDDGREDDPEDQGKEPQ